MSKINILYLHEASEVAGAENSLINLTAKLSRLEFNPIFILPKDGPLCTELKKLGVEVNFISFPKIRELRGVLKSIKHIFQLINKKGIDIIHSNSIRTHIYGAIAAKLKKIPIIWHQRNLITDEKIDLDRLLSFMPDKIICNSFAIARRFLRRKSLPCKVAVIHNGVDTDKFNSVIDGKSIRNEFGIKDDEFVIGIASRFNFMKGHETFFQAAKIILNKKNVFRENLRFLVVGSSVFNEDKPREDYLKRLIKELGIEDRVIFTGLRSDMPKAYASMDIFVLATEAEACGRVILEAMASGKPVIATDSGGSPEMVKDGVSGILFKPHDSNELAEKLLFLIENKDLAKKMGSNGVRIIQESFRIEDNVKKTEVIYHELMQKYDRSK
ncbi:MAG: glycosyltransferase [Candidatus Omnitrophica bacterium]|nr:glycosyltransferase [Candidatus Omnitrophota bacterium]